MSVTNWRKLSGIGLIVIILTNVFAGYLFPVGTTQQLRSLWVTQMALLFLFAFVAGKGVTNVWRGLFIDERNKISLSRLQIVLWTVLLLSAYLVAAVFNLHKGQPDPLAVRLDATLWGLMGISTVSLVGSSLVKSVKKDQPTNGDEKDKTLNLLNAQGAGVSGVRAEGQLLVNSLPDDARWTDLFRGEEVGNAANLDLGKVQMFFFTLIIWFAYAAALATMFKADGAGIDHFPDVSPGMLALLGISHAGYLANKAVPHTAQPTPATT
jgi:hypothetical protein